MALASIPNSIRQMHRSVKMRNSDNPEDVAEALEKILMESVVMQSSGSKMFQAAALREMKQLRNDMVAGQLNAGIKQTKMIGLYGHIIDQVEKMSEDNKSSNIAIDKAVGALAKSLPSTDSLVAALMTANPIMGYGVKIMRDIASAAAQSRSAKKNEEKKRLEGLKANEKYITEQLKNEDTKVPVIEEQAKAAEAQQDAAKEQKEVAKKAKRSYTKGGVYAPLLKEIRDEIKRLQTGISEDIERVDTSIIQQMEAANDNNIEQIQAIQNIEKANDRQAKLERMSTEAAANDHKFEPVTALPTEAVNENSQKEKGKFDFLAMFGKKGKLLAGLLGGFAGAIGGMTTFLLGGGLKLVMAPFKLLFGLGKMVIGLGSKIFLPALIIKSIYDFVDGFLNAADIIGENDSQITIGERVLAGVSNIAGKFWKFIADMADMALNYFDIDIIKNQDQLPKQIYSILSSIPDKVLSIVDYVLGTVLETYDKIKSIINGKIDSMVSGLSTLPIIGRFFGPEENQMITPTEVNSAVGVINKLGQKNDYELSGQTGSNALSSSIRRAEQANNGNGVGNIVNAPVNAPTNVNNTTIQNGSNNTGNPNNGFRRLNDLMYYGY